MPATNFTPIQLYRSTTASQVPTSGNLADGELAINTNDGKLYYKDSSGVVQLMASKAGASGDVVGPASATDNAVVRFDGTTGKLVQNSVVTIADSTGDVAGVGALTMGGNLTLNGGTANGVLYLNGSKVATSGSALTFDGTTFGNTGNGSLGEVSGAALTLKRVTSGNNIDLNFYNPVFTAGVVTRIRTDGDGINNFFGALSFQTTQTPDTLAERYRITSTGVSVWSVAGSEQMRLTSTGLGIGTSSPAAKLQVKVGTDQNLHVASAGGVLGLFGVNDAVTAPAPLQIQGTDLRFNTGTLAASERMRLDSSGNLGLGVTPSAWNTGKALEINAVGFGLWGAFGNLYLNANYYYNASDKFAGTGYALQYVQVPTTGAHQWMTSASSGTAGNTISFTQAMTLDASGNLGVGETSMAADTRLHLKSAGDIKLKVETTNNTLASGNAALVLTTGSYGYSIQNLTTTAGSAGALRFYDNTAATERARITSGGNFCVGTTSSSLSGATRSLALVSGSFAAAFQTTSSTATDEVLCLQQSATTGDNTFIIFKTEGGTGTGRGSITYNRTAGLVAYNTTSDYRAKDILGPVANPGATIDSLKVYEGKMKGATQSRPMLIAHEVQAHAPYAVTGEKDAFNEDGTPKFQQIDVSSLVPLLLAEIQSLRQRVALLEGN